MTQCVLLVHCNCGVLSFKLTSYYIGFFMWFARFQILICEPQSIWCKLLLLSWLYMRNWFSTESCQNFLRKKKCFLFRIPCRIFFSKSLFDILVDNISTEFPPKNSPLKVKTLLEGIKVWKYLPLVLTSKQVWDVFTFLGSLQKTWSLVIPTF